MSTFKVNKIFNLDVFEYFKIVPDNSIDLAVIDPPYNLSKADWDSFKNQEEFLDFTYKWIDALLPKLKKTASLYIFNTPYNNSYILQHLVKRKLIYQNWITWDKRDGISGAKQKFCANQESILFFSKKKQHTFNHDDVRIPYESTERMKHAAKKGILKNGKRWFPNPNGKLCGDVWHFSSERHKNKINGKVQKMSHITPKPLDLIERIIRASSMEGDVVLDCFMGSGTTAIAAKKLRRNYSGCEINTAHIRLFEDKILKI